MTLTPRGLVTAPFSQPATVFLVGVQCRSWRSAWKLPFIGKRMGNMQEELRADPESGLLWGANFVQFRPFTTLFLSYWKSPDHIHRFVESSRFSHQGASAEYFRRWGKDPHIGVWHETYEVHPGQEENLYFGMAPFGSSAFNDVISVGAANRRFMGRLKRAPEK